MKKSIGANLDQQNQASTSEFGAPYDPIVAQQELEALDRMAAMNNLREPSRFAPTVTPQTTAAVLKAGKVVSKAVTRRYTSENNHLKDFFDDIWQ